MSNKTGEYLNECFEDSLNELVFLLIEQKRRVEMKDHFEKLQKLIECKAEVDSLRKFTITREDVVEEFHELLEYFSQLLKKLEDLNNHIEKN